MKRSQLIKAIKIIIERRLSEVSVGDWGQESPRKPKANTNPKYAYISGQVLSDPTIQIIGHGSMKLSQLKKLMVEHIGELNKKAKEGRFDQVLYLLKPDGILLLHANALAEIQTATAGNLVEITDTNMFGEPDQSTEPDTANKITGKDDTEGMSDIDKKSLESARMNQQKLTNDRDRLKGAVQKLQEPLKRKIEYAERKMSSIEQKLGKESDKIQSIVKRYQKGRWSEEINK